MLTGFGLRPGWLRFGLLGFLPLINFSVACTITPEPSALHLRNSYITYDRSGSVKDILTQRIRYTADETEFSSFDSKQGKVTNSRIVRTGQNTLHYKDNELEAIETPGRTPGCIVKKHFSKEWFGEEQICNGEKVQGILFNSTITDEMVCRQAGSSRRCKITVNGVTEWDYLLEEEADPRISRYTRLVMGGVSEEVDTHLTRREKITSGKIEIEKEFSAFIPIGAPTLQDSDPKWKSYGWIESEDFLPGINMYRHVRFYGQDGIMHGELLIDTIN